LPFGYCPQPTYLKDLALRLFGWPNWMRRVQGPVMLRWLKPCEADKILDVGCGSGPFTYELAKTAGMVVGLDITLGQNWTNVIRKAKNVRYVLADAERLPFKKGCFSKVLASSVVQMVPRPQRLLVECARVLPVGGLLALSTPTDHVLLPKLLEKVGRGLAGTGLSGYEVLLDRLARAFGAWGRGLFSQQEIVEAVSSAGMTVRECAWVPGKLSSSLYELVLLFALRTGMPLSSPLYFPLLFPIAWLEAVVSVSEGDELLLLAGRA